MTRGASQADWSFVYEDYQPEQEGLREALCTLGNGVFATRGASPDASADETHYPGTYLAGGYDRARTEIAGREIENEDLVNLPNWLALTFRVGEEPWFAIDATELLGYRQVLDLGEGVLYRSIRFRDRSGRTTRWAERRLVSMADPHLAALSVEIAPEDWEGDLVVRSAIDGSVRNEGVDRYSDLESRHLDVLERNRLGDDAILLVSRTRQSRIEVAQAVRTRAYRGREPVAADREIALPASQAVDHLRHRVSVKQPLRIEKIAVLHTSRDPAIPGPARASAEGVRDAGGFEELARRHRSAWRRLWSRFDFEIEQRGADDGEGAQRKLRFHTFHLLQTVSPHSADLDVGVPARGWHGEAYRGHIFWDEMLIFPMLSLRLPGLARSLLEYRHRRLPAARRAAREAGHRGAMYPWQSGSDGREESQRVHLNPRSGRWVPDDSYRQRHIGSAIAYNVWSYYEVSRDGEFLARVGAEMLVEIARFWASVAEYDPETGRYHIRGVMGPDEYHTAYLDAAPEDGGLNDNAYTNLLAAWVLKRASDALANLASDARDDLQEKIGLRPDEERRWLDVSRNLFVPFHEEGLLSQFAGYDRLDEFDWDAYRDEYGEIERLDRILEAEGDTPNRYKLAKQADVVMLFYLFSADELRSLFEWMGYAWRSEWIPRNVRYYEDRTSHGSTLSRVVHAWVMARGNRARSWRLFLEALDSDIHDTQGGTTPEGIHLGAMAGTVDIVYRCYTGLEVRGNTLRFNPCLPDELRRIRFRVRYRGQVLDVDVNHESLTIASEPLTASPVAVAYRDHSRELSPGQRCEFALIPAKASGGQRGGVAHALHSIAT